jgi:hypothetical protein
MIAFIMHKGCILLSFFALAKNLLSETNRLKLDGF